MSPFFPSLFSVQTYAYSGFPQVGPPSQSMFNQQAPSLFSQAPPAFGMQQQAQYPFPAPQQPFFAGMSVYCPSYDVSFDIVYFVVRVRLTSMHYCSNTRHQVQQAFMECNNHPCCSSNNSSNSRRSNPRHPLSVSQWLSLQPP